MKNRYFQWYSKDGSGTPSILWDWENHLVKDRYKTWDKFLNDPLVKSSLEGHVLYWYDDEAEQI